jgi:hypothetical protein
MAAKCPRSRTAAVKQLNVFCEGPTEQGFCADVLQPHLFPSGSGIIHTLAVGQKDHRHVYGLGRRMKYEKVRKFISHTIKQRRGQSVYFSTLFDLYGLPNDFPGKANTVRNPANPTQYVAVLEQAFLDDINEHSFVPYLQLHEFEAMLFADPQAFAISFEHCTQQIEQLQQIAASVPSIEHIDDGSDSAPSKRIIAVLPEYEGRKSSAGPDIAGYIGIATIRKHSPHFDSWLSRIEALMWTEK